MFRSRVFASQLKMAMFVMSIIACLVLWQPIHCQPTNRETRNVASPLEDPNPNYQFDYMGKAYPNSGYMPLVTDYNMSTVVSQGVKLVEDIKRIEKLQDDSSLNALEERCENGQSKFALRRNHEHAMEIVDKVKGGLEDFSALKMMSNPQEDEAFLGTLFAGLGLGFGVAGWFKDLFNPNDQETNKVKLNYSENNRK